jgi:nucleotide-binding universal stress UspA family protein
VGIFLEDLTYTSYNTYEEIMKKGFSDEILKKKEEKDNKLRNAAVAHFENACQKAEIEFSTHRDRNIAIQALKHESIYSDLLLIGVKETLTHYTEKPPTHFIRDLLADTQCPVFLVPEKYKLIDKIILLYDGEPSSVYAIKMFSYLLPQLKYLDTEVLTVNPEKASLHLPDKKLMKEFMKQHFPNAEYKVLKGYAEDEIVKHLKQQNENTLVVLGAYRRGTVSRWFRESMADVLMKELKLPLFIAHNK